MNVIGAAVQQAVEDLERGVATFVALGLLRDLGMTGWSTEGNCTYIYIYIYIYRERERETRE